MSVVAVDSEELAAALDRSLFPGESTREGSIPALLFVMASLTKWTPDAWGEKYARHFCRTALPRFEDLLARGKWNPRAREGTSQAKTRLKRKAAEAQRVYHSMLYVLGYYDWDAAGGCIKHPFPSWVASDAPDSLASYEKMLSKFKHRCLAYYWTSVCTPSASGSSVRAVDTSILDGLKAAVADAGGWLIKFEDDADDYVRPFERGVRLVVNERLSLSRGATSLTPLQPIQVVGLFLCWDYVRKNATDPRMGTESVLLSNAEAQSELAVAVHVAKLDVRNLMLKTFEGHYLDAIVPDEDDLVERKKKTHCTHWTLVPTTTEVQRRRGRNVFQLNPVYMAAAHVRKHWDELPSEVTVPLREAGYAPSVGTVRDAQPHSSEEDATQDDDRFEGVLESMPRHVRAFPRPRPGSLETRRTETDEDAPSTNDEGDAPAANDEDANDEDAPVTNARSENAATCTTPQTHAQPEPDTPAPVQHRLVYTIRKARITSPAESDDATFTSTVTTTITTTTVVNPLLVATPPNSPVLASSLPDFTYPRASDEEDDAAPALVRKSGAKRPQPSGSQERREENAKRTRPTTGELSPSRSGTVPPSKCHADDATVKTITTITTATTTTVKDEERSASVCWEEIGKWL